MNNYQNKAIAVCEKTEEKCPFGVIKFTKLEEEYSGAKERLERMKRHAKRNDNNSYILRIRKSEILDKYEPNGEVTFHYKEERSAREDLIKSQLGEGTPIRYYKVNHLVKDDFYEDQVFEVLSNGQVRIYDNRNGKLVTTFIPTKQRLEIIMLSAGDVPEESWINNISKEKKIFDNNWDKVKHLYSKKRESRFSKNIRKQTLAKEA